MPGTPFINGRTPGLLNYCGTIILGDVPIDWWRGWEVKDEWEAEKEDSNSSSHHSCLESLWEKDGIQIKL